MNSRKLALRRELLTELETTELAGLAGGPRYSADAITCPLLSACLAICMSGDTICVCTRGCGD